MNQIHFFYRKKWRFICFALIGSLLFPALAVQANAQPCDPDLMPDENAMIRYKPRGNRCEGFYRSQVSAGSLDIVGITRGEFVFKLDQAEIIEIEAPDAGNKDVYIRAVGIPLKTYYRMDATVAPGKKFSMKPKFGWIK